MNDSSSITTNTTAFEKVNDIFQCKLVLENNVEFVIPMREDGYIFATKLCQAAGKQLSKWKRSPDTKRLIEKKISSCPLGITEIIEVHQGGSGYQQGTWVHPDLGIHLAQWCSPSFSIQVSQWMRELLITNTVTIGQEKSENELQSALVLRLQEAEEKVKQAENIILSQANQNAYLSKQLTKLAQNHQAILRRKELYKLKEGPCVYIINMSGDDTDRYKIGRTSDVTNRVSGFRTSNPLCRVLFVLYTSQHVLLENVIKARYETQFLPNNHEFISGISLEDLQKSIVDFAIFVQHPYRIETEEELSKFNSHIILDHPQEDQFSTDVLTHKRCGGMTHLQEEDRMIPITNFFKNISNADGVARLCKDCYHTSTYGDKRKRRKTVLIPPYDIKTHKWCNRCETARTFSEFFNDRMTRDGLGSNCKNCKHEQKIQRKLASEQKIEM